MADIHGQKILLSIHIDKYTYIINIYKYKSTEYFYLNNEKESFKHFYKYNNYLYI